MTAVASSTTYTNPHSALLGAPAPAAARPLWDPRGRPARPVEVSAAITLLFRRRTACVRRPRCFCAVERRLASLWLLPRRALDMRREVRDVCRACADNS